MDIDTDTPKPVLSKKQFRILLALQELRGKIPKSSDGFFAEIRLITGRDFHKVYTDVEQFNILQSMLPIRCLTPVTYDNITSVEVTKFGHRELFRVREWWERCIEPWDGYYLPSRTPNFSP